MIAKICLSVLLCFLFLIFTINFILYDNFVIENKSKKFHGCLNSEHMLSAEDSLKSNLKGWCGTFENYKYNSHENINSNNESVNKSKKCLPPFQRASGLQSYNTELNAWCLR